MKIKGKLYSVIIFTISVFIFCIVFLLFSIINIIHLKNFELSIYHVASSLNELNNEVKATFISDSSTFFDPLNSPVDKLSEFKNKITKDLQEIKRLSAYKNMNKDIKEKINSLEKIWEGSQNDFISIEEILVDNYKNEFNRDIDKSVVFEQLINDMKSGKIEISQYKNLLQVSYQSAQIAYNTVNASVVSIMDDVSKSVEKDVKNKIIIMIILIVTATILTFIIFSIFSQKLVKRIINIEKAMNKVSQKDLTVRIQVKLKDEIDNLAKYINNVLIIIQDFFKSVKKATGHVSELKDILSTGTVESASALNEMKGSISSINRELNILDENISLSGNSVAEINKRISFITDGINKQVNAIDETNKSIVNMNNLFKEISNISNEKKEKAEILIKNVSKGGEDVRKTNEIIKSISDQVNQILQIIEIIDGISEKTNLLSINAAIESARSESKGKGFSIIADEIGKLAESSSGQSNQISNILAEIVQKIKNAMISSGTSYNSFNDITGEVKTFVNALTEITEKMNKVTMSSNSVLDLTNSVSDMTKEISTVSSEINKSAQSINQSINSLKDISMHVVSGMQEIDTAIQEILISVSQISSVSVESKSRMEELDSMISTFKVT